MRENDIEKVIVMLTSRAIIPNIYTKERVSDLINLDITDAEWNYLLKNQYVLSSDNNQILIKWINSLRDNNDDIEYSDSDSSDYEYTNTHNNLIINKLASLPYTVLQHLAEINNKSKKKTELVQIIINKIKYSY